MTLTHVSNAILVVHHFIRDLVELCCPDDMVRRELWNHVLDEVIPRYRRAMEQARFLLSVERDGRPLTVNPEFRHAKKQADVDRAKRKIKNSRFPKAKESGDDEYKYILTYKALTNVLAGEAGDAEESQSHIIHDVLKSYYGVARSRFVDAVCQQAVDRFLVSGKDGPLQVVSERWVNRMKAADLERIAGEAQADKNRRKDLEQEIERLKKARSIILK
jgi:hypothetical protein